MRDAKPAIEQIGEAGIEEHLNQNRHGEHRDDQWFLDYCLPLEGEQQHESREQCTDRIGTETSNRLPEMRVTLGKQLPPQQLREDDWNNDVQANRDDQRIPRHRDG